MASHGSLVLCLALLIPSASAEDQMEAARSAARSGDRDRAVVLYGQALRKDAKWADGWQEFGILLADFGRYSEAREAFRTLVLLRPEDGDALTLLGLTEFREKRYEAALDHLERARTLPFRTNGLYRLLEYHSALILISRGEFDSAQKRLHKLARLTVETTDIAEAEGLAALHKQALPADLSEADRTVAREVGAVVISSRRLPADAAARQWKRLLARFPALAWLQYSFGMYLISVGRVTDAVAAFEREATMSPTSVWPVVQIAACKLMLGEAEAALLYADRAINLDPQLFAGFLFRGRALLNLGRDQEAIAPLETAARLAPMSERVYGVLQTAYARVGRPEDARRAAVKAEQLRGNDAAAPGSGVAPATQF